MSSAKKCTAETHRFNCGCCDDTTLFCHQDEGHNGAHACVIDHVMIVWDYEDGWKAGRTDAVRIQ